MFILTVPCLLHWRGLPHSRSTRGWQVHGCTNYLALQPVLQSVKHVWISYQLTSIVHRSRNEFIRAQLLRIAKQSKSHQQGRTSPNIVLLQLNLSNVRQIPCSLNISLALLLKRPPFWTGEAHIPAPTHKKSTAPVTFMPRCQSTPLQRSCTWHNYIIIFIFIHIKYI